MPSTRDTRVEIEGFFAEPVDVSLIVNGQEVPLGTVEPGEWFGLRSVLHQQRSGLEGTPAGVFVEHILLPQTVDTSRQLVAKPTRGRWD